MGRSRLQVNLPHQYRVWKGLLASGHVGLLSGRIARETLGINGAAAILWGGVPRGPGPAGLVLWA